MTPPNCLFVYGTLMSTAAGSMGREQRARLSREARVVGPARLQGRLYDLGRYPGLVDSAATADIVHGELIALADPATALGWLDAYEGITPGSGGRNEYRREVRRVFLGDADTAPQARGIDAWVYVYVGDITAARLLADGRWSGS